MLLASALAAGCLGQSREPDEDARPPSEPVIPNGRTAAADLAPAGFRHDLVLQIAQDFHPNDDYAIALDAWRPASAPAELQEVRMWWLDTGKDAERSVFGKGVKRHITIEYRKTDAATWVVSIIRGSTAYDFSVEVTGSEVLAFVDITTEAGATISRCRATRAALKANKVLGIPVGIDGIEISCDPGDGTSKAGRLVEREV